MSTSRNTVRAFASNQGEIDVSTAHLGQAFLSTLVGLIQPIIQTCVPPTTTQQRAHTVVTEAEVATEGQELLSALDKFIVGIVQRQIQKTAKKPSVVQDESNDPDTIARKLENLSLTLHRNPTPPPSLTLPSVFMDDLGSHIFNKMPIRLLAFDSSGTTLRLIERKDMFAHIIQTASQPQYQDEVRRTIAQGGHNPSFLKIIASYAILSHTWLRGTPGEIVFQDWTTRADNPLGNSKITKFCEIAATKHNITLGWMDTICINKESSSELDESIRSMYKWYRDAAVCVAYLADTNHLTEIAQDTWFTRGWTLQELVAPQDIQFYNKNWIPLDDLSGDSGVDTTTIINTGIEQATTITEHELYTFRCSSVSEIPISRRMQLGAKRRVTREEDMAYSMMGIVGVDISTAYGEGSGRAFSRLIQAYLTTQKHTLDVFNHTIGGNLVPTSITQYTDRSLRFDRTLDAWQPDTPITVTHLGVQVQPLIISAIQTSFLHGLPFDYEDAGPFMKVTVHWKSDSTDAEPQGAEYVTSSNPTFLPMLQDLKSTLLAGFGEQYDLRDKYIIDLGILNVRDAGQGQLVSIPTEIPTLALPLWNDYWWQEENTKFPGQYTLHSMTARPVVFEWTEQEVLPKEDLELYGMRIQSLYL